LILTAKGMVLMVTLPERLRELRKSNNLTQAQVAEILHISRPAYTQYETGNKQPSIETLVKLADLFKTSVDYLIGRY
jgi:transcriptional regulator with XRE-family HTH domain